MFFRIIAWKTGRPFIRNSIAEHAIKKMISELDIGNIFEIIDTRLTVIRPFGALA